MPPAFVDGTEVFAAPNSIYLPVRERDNNNLTFISRIKRESGITRTWKRSVGTIPVVICNTTQVYAAQTAFRCAALKRAMTTMASTLWTTTAVKTALAPAIPRNPRC